MVLVVWGFLYAAPWDVEVMRQVNVTTIDPGLHRRLGYGVAIRTTAALDFHLWVNLVFVPIMGVSGCCGSDTHRREDEPSHGIPQVFGMCCSFERLCPSAPASGICSSSSSDMRIRSATCGCVSSFPDHRYYRRDHRLYLSFGQRQRVGSHLPSFRPLRFASGSPRCSGAQSVLPGPSAQPTPKPLVQRVTESVMQWPEDPPRPSTYFMLSASASLMSCPDGAGGRSRTPVCLDALARCSPSCRTFRGS